mmetsp:Transcript_18470/g.53957  ORF Transcript_18470/g.53957 Transcript_18470/m.53957 type:complete len:222 (-) Transcript_18470:617-1282(-)
MRRWLPAPAPGSAPTPITPSSSTRTLRTTCVPSGRRWTRQLTSAVTSWRCTRHSPGSTSPQRLSTSWVPPLHGAWTGYTTRPACHRRVRTRRRSRPQCTAHSARRRTTLPCEGRRCGRRTLAPFHRKKGGRSQPEGRGRTVRRCRRPGARLRARARTRPPCAAMIRAPTSRTPCLHWSRTKLAPRPWARTPTGWVSGGWTRGRRLCRTRCAQRVAPPGAPS